MTTGCLLCFTAAAACPLQVLVTCTRNQAVDAVVDKLARVDGSLLVFGREERLGSRAKLFLLKERVARHPHVLAWLGWIEELQELTELVEQAPAEGDDDVAAAVLEEALSLVRLPVCHHAVHIVPCHCATLATRQTCRAAKVAIKTAGFGGPDCVFAAADNWLLHCSETAQPRSSWRPCAGCLTGWSR